MSYVLTLGVELSQIFDLSLKKFPVTVTRRARLPAAIDVGAFWHLLSCKRMLSRLTINCQLIHVEDIFAELPVETSKIRRPGPKILNSP